MTILYFTLYDTLCQLDEYNERNEVIGGIMINNSIDD